MDKILWLIFEHFSYSARTTIGKSYFAYRFNYVTDPPELIKEYFGYCLEDTARPGNVKVYGETCLPGGLECDVSLVESQKFGKTIVFHTEPDKRTIKFGVLTWTDVYAHGGNSIADTLGCVIVAKNLIDRDHVQGSLKNELRTFVELKMREGYKIKAKFINLDQTQNSVISIHLKKSIMENSSWKTMVVGAVLAILIAIQPLLETGEIDWKAVILAAMIALFSYLVKDSDVTGGTRSNKMTLKKP